MTLRLALRAMLVLLAVLSLASPAYAYLDPGTGSMLVSAVIGVAAAVGLALKMFWYRVTGLFRGKKGGTQPGRVDGAPSAKE
jgi:NADH:ubiquinone oxidoreductase subunit K